MSATGQLTLLLFLVLVGKSLQAVYRQTLPNQARKKEFETNQRVKEQARRKFIPVKRNREEVKEE